MMNTKHKRPLLVLLTLPLLLVACKEGDLLEGGISPATAAFLPDTIPPGTTDHIVSLEESTSSEGRILLDVVVTEVSEVVSGTALKITYPEAISKIVSCSPGELFPGGTCYFDETNPGEVLLAISATGPGAGSAVSGSRSILTLEFLVFAQGAEDVRFEGQNLGPCSTPTATPSSSTGLPACWQGSRLLAIMPARFEGRIR
jgi:hypothetical protein